MINEIEQEVQNVKEESDQWTKTYRIATEVANMPHGFL